MKNTMDYLKVGNEKQRAAYRAIQSLGVMEDLSDFSPVLCGTIPIDIAIESSDLDIIMEVHDFNSFEKRLLDLYGGLASFQVKRTIIRDRRVIKANFTFEDFEFELFGQDQPLHEQFAYLHMVIEEKLILDNPALKEEIIKLKNQGYKTEPAFCTVLGLKGDPYEKLIEYGKNRGVVP